MKFPILAIDYGKKHIGVAVSDSKGIVSTPLPVIDVTNKRSFDGAIADIKKVCDERQVQSILFGMPQAFVKAHEKAQEEIKLFIEQVVKTTGLEYQTIDESFSTLNAQNVLLSTGQRTKGSRNKIDSVAAALFLQEHLDNLDNK